MEGLTRPYWSFCLYVDITQRPGKRAHHVFDLDSRRQYTHVNCIRQCPVPTWRVVQQRNRPGNRVLSGCQVLILPDPPSPVNLAVVQEEHRVAGGSEEVAAGVATDGEVAARVDAVEAGGKVALHGGLE